MVPYIFVAYGSAILSKLSSLRGLRALWWVLPAGLLIAFSGFRLEVGTDFDLYRHIYYAIDPYSITRSIETIPQEFGFVSLMFVVRQFTDSFQVLLFVCAILTVLPIFVAIRRVSSMPTLSVFLYITLAYYPISLNAIRQSIAVSLVVLAETYRTDRKWLWISLSLLAATFHVSSLLASLSLAVARRLSSRLTLLFFLSLGIGVFGAALFRVSFVVDILTGLNERYGRYIADAEGAGVGTVLVLSVHIAIAVFCMWQLKGSDESTDRNWAAYYILSICLLILATTNWLAGRLEPYFGTFAIFAIPVALRNSSQKLLWTLFIGALATVYFLAHITFYNDLVPYKSVL